MSSFFETNGDAVNERNRRSRQNTLGRFETLYLVDWVGCRNEKRVHHKIFTVNTVVTPEKCQQDKNEHDGTNNHRQNQSSKEPAIDRR